MPQQRRPGEGKEKAYVQEPASAEQVEFLLRNSTPITSTIQHILAGRGIVEMQSFSATVDKDSLGRLLGMRRHASPSVKRPK